MERCFSGATIRVQARDARRPHVDVTLALEGLEIGRARRDGERVVARAPRWERGYSGEQIGLESAYVRGIALALEGDAAPDELLVGAPSVADLGFPDEPAAFVALSTLAREASERSLSAITLLIPAEDVPVYQAVFDEWSDTMLGT